MERPTRRWQFSLRELLLAMTSLAAVLVLVIQNWPSGNARQQSAFAAAFDPLNLAQQTMAEFGVKRPYPNGGSAESHGPREGVSELIFSAEFEANGISRAELANQLFPKISKQLESSKAEYVGIPLRGGGTEGETLGFAYRDGNVRGVFRIVVENREPDSLYISGFLCEFADLR